MTLRAGVTVLACGLVTGFAEQAAAQVQWRVGTGAAPKRESAGALKQKVANLAARPSQKRVIAHFDEALTKARKAQMSAAGLTILDYLGNNAYFASIDPAADPARIAALNGLITVEPILNPWKLHPDFNAGIIYPWVIVEGIKDMPMAAGNGLTREQLREMGVDPMVAAAVAVHRDADMAAVSDRLLRLGARIVHEYKTIKGFDVEMPLSQVYALAGDDDVRWIEPAMPPLSTCNDSNRALTQTDVINAAPYGLDGTGVDVMVYDGGAVATTHAALSGRVFVGDGATPATHATHVAGTIGGTGAGSAGNIHRGMAPNVQFLSYAVGGFTQGYFRHILGDTEADYLDAISRGADVANNSVGSNTATNGWPCEHHGDYGLFNEMLDSLIRGERDGQDGVPFRTIWAAGNERQTSRCRDTAGEPQGDLGFYSIAPPQGGKNQVCVGAVNSNDDSITSFTSFGPTDDGRLKPDFCAPGCQSDGDDGVTSCSASGGYTTLCGTSMASPTATGIAALFLQDWRATYSDLPDPRNATIKSIFAHTAVDIDDPGPDYRTGYGSIRAPRIIEHMRSGNFVEAEVDHGQSYNFVVVVSPSDTEFKVTLAWDDFRGNAAVLPQLVNDLDLVVYSPSGVRHYPWTLNPAVPDDPAVQTAENHRDNIEQVYVANPEPGGWLVEVRGTSVPEGPQIFTACASPLLVNCSDAGVVGLDRPRYACVATGATVRVGDCGLNTSDTVIDTVVVHVSSTSDPTGEMVTLTEVSPEAATFVGTAPLSTDGAPGTVRIAAGDVITVRYVDADDGNGNMVMVTQTAEVDCTPPVISNVVVSNIEARSADVSFDASERVTAVLNYGTSCASPTEALAFTRSSTSHSGSFTGLSDNTTYFFTITATDEAGNSATFDNKGQCFSFGTPELADYFTQQFTSGSDLQMKRLTFTPNSSVDFYHACLEDVTEFNTDPAGGTIVARGDDTFTQVSLSGGRSVQFYGVNYTNFFVGSNGYITFTAGDSDFSESLADHFDLPRISGWFDDLYPTQGQCSWRQLDDRAAVTWLNVPECCGSNNPNTFQIELYFDGRVAITWLTINSSDGITGLSRGMGIPEDFVESDLSTLSDGCGSACPCDWDASGGVNSQDFFDFLTDFFAGSADYNNDGFTNSQDFFDFLGCFFTSCIP